MAVADWPGSTRSPHNLIPSSILNINSSFHHALIKLYTGDPLIFEGCHSNSMYNFWYSKYVHYIKCHILYQFSNNLEWNQNWSLVLSAMESFNHNFRILNKIFNILLFNKKCKFQIWLLKNWFIVALHARVEKMFSAQPLYFLYKMKVWWSLFIVW